MFKTQFLRHLLVMLGIWTAAGVSGCDSNSGDERDEKNEKEKKKAPVFTDTLSVTISAYNSLKLQGEGNATITAWGDTLVPGMKSIAVSRDLIKKGLTRGTPVVIEGLEGIYFVNDKMHQRWKNKIDIYMGIDREKAMEWGRKKRKISFPGKKQEVIQEKLIEE